MLQNHQVDLVGTAQWNRQREEEYEFCLQEYGYTFAEFATLADHPMIFEDYQAIGQSVIGCTSDYVRMPEMQEMFVQHNISPEIKTYPTQKELLQALETGEIDIVAANSHTILDEYNVIERFCYTPYFFISWKGNEALTDAIDEAITMISLYEKPYLAELEKEFLPELLTTPLTKEEMDCIAENNTYTIYFDANTKPLVWINDDGEMEGILVDICSRIEENTGLHFQYKSRLANMGDETEDPYRIDYHTFISSVDNVLDSGTVEEGYTNALLKDNFSIYHRLGTDYDESKPYKIAVPAHRSGAAEYLSAAYPNFQIVEYGNPKECLENVSYGKVDFAFLCETVADTTILENDIQNVTPLHATTLSMGIGFLFHGEKAPLLASIVNKGINQISMDNINDIELGYAMNVKPKVTIQYWLRNNPYMIFIIVAILVVMGVLLTRTRVLKQESRKIEEANRAKSDFLSQMSHDMRTPMNAILGLTALSLDEPGLTPEIKDNLSNIRNSGEFLLGLVNDVLDMSKIESGKIELHYEPYYYRDFLSNMKTMFAPLCEQNGLHFELEEVTTALTILADKVRLNQIFFNILSNAVKYTPEGGTVSYYTRNLKLEGNRGSADYIIQDTGIGMSEEFQKQMFEPFKQENTQVTASLQGTGLGLSIAKNLVEAMGGTLQIESQLHVGTKVIIHLSFEIVPDQPQEKANRTSEEDVTAILSGKRILLAEDHPLNAAIAQKLLEKAGIRVDVVNNGKQCVDKFRYSPEDYYHMILMDIRMPVMDGYEATREIRALKREDAKSIPIIAMTANAYQSDITDCMNAGMNAHMAKPIDPQTMYGLIASHLK